MRLAFVDHHLDNFHANAFRRLLNGEALADRGVELAAAYESHPTGDGDWCSDHAVPRSGSVTDAVDAADAVLVLAPDNLDTHLAFAREVVPHGKPVVFDKLLALDPADAWQIVEMGRDHGTPIFSGSALRYATEAESLLRGVDPARIDDAFARGYGDWDNYGIHTLSLGVRLGGHGVTRVREVGTTDSRCLVLDHRDRRTLVDCRTGDNARSALGWTCGVKVAGEWRTAAVTDTRALYVNLLDRYLEFFAGGEPDSSPEELAGLVAMLAGSGRSLESDGAWVPVSQGQR